MAGALNALALDSLNAHQREAVTLTEGPLLVLAGAGSGKTRVVTTRIAYLILARRVPPGEVLAMTFTNKAAREMGGRVASMVKGGRERPSIGTFHSFGVRFLRRHIELLGYGPDFSIYDEHDQLQVVRDVLGEMDAQTWYTDKSALYALQRAKSGGLGPQDLLQLQDSPSDVLLGAVYREYQRILREMNAVDFEDLLKLPMWVCRDHPEAAGRYFERFRYVLVDEYQDTNKTQHDLLRHVTAPHGNVCAVGDDDQSIYAWRGAEPGNILNFEEDFPGTRVIRLERNYRSTDTILSAANQLIAHNPERKGKTLHGIRGPGKPLEWIEGDDERDELEKVVTHLKLNKLRAGTSLSSVAILYRSNFQSRGIEEVLREEAIPYLLVGGTRFYDRREIKDAVAYLRLVHNPNDEVSLNRAINFPGRGIGRTTRARLLEIARRESQPCMAVMRRARGYREFTGPAAQSLESLAALLDRYRARFEREPLGEAFRALLAELGFHRAVEKEKSDPKAKETAVALVHELEQATDLYARRHPQARLKAYLERIALYTMPEEPDGEGGRPMVRLMTVHSAKGLEFPHVYVIGMAEDVFPHRRSLEEGGEAEERRLAYVAITRAEKQLVFSMGKERRRYREVIPQRPSRFVLEIDPALFDGVPPAAGDAAAYQPIQERKKAAARSRFFDQLRKLQAGG
ncbi:MAG: UvrD-helicase domain-containing protein [SAR324 cluster bacterium]|nr:UvrD-helicase domain-containing protein [SAR324 cluster bacterium]